MQNLYVSKLVKIVLGVFFMLSIISCGSSKKARKELLYFQGNIDTLPNQVIVNKEVVFKKGDLLSIVVYSDNPEATAIYNQQSSGGISTGNVASSSSGYLINEAGEIYFHTLGTIHIEGLTKKQFADQLVEKLKVYLKNPYVIIRVLNFRFTIIGEVNKPGPIMVPEEKISILEMIGLAGDLTVYGRRDNVLIIREKDGKREFGRIDLRSSNIFQSPYFYLQQNDVVVVEPTRQKPTVNDQVAARNLTIATSIAGLLTTLVVIYNLVK